MAKPAGGQTIIIKKISGGHGGHHGGAWKVAYADFVTAMMAFFMVMWLMGADEETKASIEEYFKNPGSESPSGTFQSPKGGDKVRAFEEKATPGGRPIDMPLGKYNAQTVAENPLIQMKELLEETISLELGVSSASENLNITYDSKGLVLKIVVKDFFKPGETAIRPDLKPIINRIGKVLSSSKQLIRIEGHADSQESRSADLNAWALSSERASSVAQYWLGTNSSFRANRLQVAGNSYFRPVADNDTEQGRAANRRVEIVVLNNQFDAEE